MLITYIILRFANTNHVNSSISFAIFPLIIYLDISEMVDVCTGYEVRATCWPNENIIGETSRFRRMVPGKCISAESGNLAAKKNIYYF